MRKGYKPENNKRKRASVPSTYYIVYRCLSFSPAPLLMLCYLLSSTSYTTYLYLLIPLVIFWGEYFMGTFIGGKDNDKMTFEQFLEAYELEEDFQDSGMTPEEYLKSVFEEEPVYNYENTEDLF